MPVIPATESAEIAGLFTSGKVAEGFSRLKRFTDLKQNDLPSLDKKAVVAVGASADAVRDFARGLFSDAPSVRRMARKYAGKLGDAGAPAIVLALAEAIQPLRKIARPEEGVLGSFGGFASPLGKTLDDVKPSTTIPQNGFSEAWKLTRDALEAAVAALCDGPLEWIVRAFEYTTALTRPFARLPPAPALSEAWPGQPAISIAGTIREGLKEKIMALARKGDAALFSLVERWTTCQLTLEDDARAGTPEALLRARFRELAEKDQQAGRMLARLSAADLLRYPLPLDVATKLYWILKAAVLEPTTEDEKLLARMLVGFERRHPRETGGTPPEPLPRLAPIGGPSAAAKKDAATARALSPDVGLPSAGDEKPLLYPWAGTSREDALNALIRVAAALGLPDAWERLRKDLEDDWLDDSWRPKPGSAPPGAEAAVDHAREGVKSLAREAPERKKLVKALAQPAFNQDDGTFLPEDALKRAAWVDDLGAVVASTPNAAARVTGSLILLPTRLLEKHAGAFAEAADSLSDDEVSRLTTGIGKTVLVRGASLVPVLGPLAQRLGRGPWARTEEWMFALAILFRYGEAGRRAAAEAIRVVALPSPDEMYRRHLWNRPYHWVFRRAWEARAAAFLAAAFERLCVPAYFKGARAMIPDAERLAFDGMAASAGSASPGRELPVADVFAFVAEAAPKSLPAILANAAECAGFEKCAASILQLAAKLPATRPLVERHVDDLVAVVESPTDARVKQGLDILTAIPGLLSPSVDRVLRALERTAGSASPGVTQSTASLLGAVGASHKERRNDCVQLLEELLFSENVPTIAETMKALRSLAPSAKGAAAVLSAKGRNRVEALGEQEPRKLGKLAQDLLQ